MKNPLIRKVQETISFYRMLETGSGVVVAVSGGPDSVALLYLLDALNSKYCLDMTVAHLDHNLRKNSRQDCSFVHRLADRFKIPFYAERIDWKKKKKSGSLEDDLRRRRYAFLLRVARKTKSRVIVLGHTKDDQAETVLMRLIRGSGLYGLSAILPKRSLEGISLVRPLIEIERDEIMGYLKKNRIRYKIDETNKDERFFRNKIRRNLLPLLVKNYNPGIKETLSNFALLVGADYRYLNSLTEDFLAKNSRQEGRRLKISIEPLAGIDVALRRLVFRNALVKIDDQAHAWAFRHSREIEELAASRPEGSEVHLPQGVCVLKTARALEFFQGKMLSGGDSRGK